MTRGRRSRPLTDEDRRLWALVKASARPIAPVPPEEEEPLPPEPAAPPKPAAAGPPPVLPKKPAPPQAALPGAIDRRTRAKLSRGSLDVDSRIDLHGLTQSAAHQRLRRYLEEAQAGGARLVLVITGKGALGERADFGSPERGVLRRAVPDWLQSAAFRHLVAGYDEAGRRHGGTGAIYVRIRRRRDGG